MISLNAIPSYVDVADSTFAVDQPLKASTMTQLAHNAKFAMCRREVFQCTATNGQTIPAPVSPIDGYQYSYSEVTFWWTRQNSYSQATQKPSGGGCILSWADSVSSVGVVSVETNYFIDGGADTPTNDGELCVFLLCQRNAGLRFGSVPTWADVEDADFGGGQAVLASNLLQLNKNIRYACVRKEFFVQTLYNGQSIAPCVSPVDGYTYQLEFQPAIAAPSAPALSQVPSQDGSTPAQTIYVKVTLVNPAGETTPSAESSLAVTAGNVLEVASPAAAGNATAYNVYAASATGAEVLQNASPVPLGTPWLMPSSGLVRGVTLPTANTTAMSEMHFLPSMISSLPASGHTSGSGTARQFGVVIGGMPGVSNPATFGQVSSFVNYYVNGGAYTPTGDGTILVLIVCTRQRGNPPIPPAVRTQPPPASMTAFGTYAFPAGTATIGGFPIKGVGDSQQIDIDSETKNLLLYNRHSPVVTTAITANSNLATGQKIGGDSGLAANGGSGLLGIGLATTSDPISLLAINIVNNNVYTRWTDTVGGGRMFYRQSTGGLLQDVDGTAAVTRYSVTSTGLFGIARVASGQIVEAAGNLLAVAANAESLLQDTTGGGLTCSMQSTGGLWQQYDITHAAQRAQITGGGLVGIAGSPSGQLDVFGVYGRVVGTSTNWRITDTTGGGREFGLQSVSTLFRFNDDTAGTFRGEFDAAGNYGLGGGAGVGLDNFIGSQRVQGTSPYMYWQDNASGGHAYYRQSISGLLEEWDNTASAERLSVGTSGLFGVGRNSGTYQVESIGTVSVIASGAALVGDDTAAGGITAIWQSASGILGEYRAGTQRRWLTSVGHGLDRSPATYELEAAGTIGGIAAQPSMLLDDTSTGGRSMYLQSYSAILGVLDQTAGSVLRASFDASGNMGIGASTVSGFPLSVLGVGAFDTNSYMRASLGPHSTSMNKQGSVAPVAGTCVITFSATSSPAGVNVQVTAGDIYLPDGSTISVPAFNTTYTTWDAGFAIGYPTAPGSGSVSNIFQGNVVWNVALSQVQVQQLKHYIGQVNPTPAPFTGANLAACAADGLIPLQIGGYADLTTAAGGGTSGGGGSGGGGDICPAADQPIETLERGRVAAGTLRVGDHIRGEGNEWVTVTARRDTHGPVVMVIVSRGDEDEMLVVTPAHRVMLADGSWSAARNLRRRTKLAGGGRVTTVQEIANDRRIACLSCEGHVYRIGTVINHNSCLN